MFIVGRQLAFVITVLTFLAVFLLPYVYRKREKIFGSMRPITAMEHIEEAVGRAAEMGTKVHFTAGAADLVEAQAPEMLAGMSVMGRVAEICAKRNVPIYVTCRWPLVYQLSQAIVRDAYTRARYSERYSPSMVQFTSPDTFAYVQFVCQYLLSEKPAANFFMGHFRGHTLLFAEAAAVAGCFTIAGGGQYEVYWAMCCDYFTVGEELYAAGGVASGDPVQKASIAAHDIVKSVILVVLLAGIVAAAVGSRVITQLLAW